MFDVSNASSANKRRPSGQRRRGQRIMWRLRPCLPGMLGLGGSYWHRPARFLASDVDRLYPAARVRVPEFNWKLQDHLVGYIAGFMANQHELVGSHNLLLHGQARRAEGKVGSAGSIGSSGGLRPRNISD